jgi:hypothetical protein
MNDAGDEAHQPQQRRSAADVHARIVTPGIEHHAAQSEHSSDSERDEAGDKPESVHHFSPIFEQIGVSLSAMLKLLPFGMS